MKNLNIFGKMILLLVFCLSDIKIMTVSLPLQTNPKAFILVLTISVIVLRLLDCFYRKENYFK